MQKWIFLLIGLWATSFISAQEHFNLKSGKAAQGYDVVSYFDEEPAKGHKKYSTTHEGVTFTFSSEANKMRFLENPAQFLPEYGGFCAYAIAKNGKKVGVDPKTYLISDGKLYLFYNSWGVNTLKKWQEEGPVQLQKQADSNWEQIISQD